MATVSVQSCTFIQYQVLFWLREKKLILQIFSYERLERVNLATVATSNDFYSGVHRLDIELFHYSNYDAQTFHESV